MTELYQWLDAVSAVSEGAFLSILIGPLILIYGKTTYEKLLSRARKPAAAHTNKYREVRNEPVSRLVRALR